MGYANKHPMRLILFSITAILFTLGLFSSASAQEGEDRELLEQGAQIYAENCAVCHGEDGQGRVGATLAKDWPSIRPDLRIQETIERGVAGSFMPAWGEALGGPLDQQEIEAVTRYILSWETGQPRIIFPTPTIDTRVRITPPPGVTGDPNNGARLFATNCAVCHGPDGQGRVGANLSQDWPSIRPDLRVKSVIENGVEGSVMPAWSMANGGPLDDQEIDDIVAYILTLPSSEFTPEDQEPPAGPFTGWLAWVLFIGAFILIIAAIAYYSRQRIPED
jgi:cytochrome c oxidase cbb3-type subunit 3